MAGAKGEPQWAEVVSSPIRRGNSRSATFRCTDVVAPFFVRVLRDGFGLLGRILNRSPIIELPECDALMILIAVKNSKTLFPNGVEY